MAWMAQDDLYRVGARDEVEVRDVEIVAEYTT